ncbi:MAG: hypothetical protein IMY73_04620 [Bacteroidetes bacterium]|nr:hypothetical protein [Bacteroidota bacterium]
MKTIRTIIIVVSSFFLGVSLGYRNTPISKGSFKVKETITHNVDTVRDTLYYPKEKKIIDTFHYYHTDIDTSYIVLDIEQQVIEGSKFTAWISGVRPKLDSIETYNDIETRYIERVEYLNRKPKRWGVGVQVGYGATTNNGNVRLSPYIGVGVSYNIIQF